MAPVNDLVAELGHRSPPGVVTCRGGGTFCSAKSLPPCKGKGLPDVWGLAQHGWALALGGGDLLVSVGGLEEEGLFEGAAH